MLERVRQLDVACGKTWGVGFSPTVKLIVPATTNMSPFGRVVAVGYQRPLFMSGRWIQVRVGGSNTDAKANPTPLVMWPPKTKRRPSGPKPWPLQKML